MIVICERCQSRFQLDEKRIKANARSFTARCSRCRHVFTAYRPVRVQEIPFIDLSAAKHVTHQGNTIAISNQKGGVAKTSTCLNLGLALTQLGKRVLLIDFDVQANLSILLGRQETASFYDVLQNGPQAMDNTLVQTPYPDLWLLPAGKNMVLLNKKFFGAEDYEYILNDRLNLVKNRFDFILIDTPPSIEFFTLNALTASDRVIIPTPCDYLSTHGVDQILSIIDLIRRKTNPAIEARILVTMYDEDETAARVIFSKLQELYRGQLYPTVIPHDSRLREAQIMGMPVSHYDQQSRSGQQYMALAREIAETTDRAT
ncbi:MAG: zinc-ribbon domain-containing protein [Desulfosarcina sp.]|nr:zinc-ribbon domain-containing protein [Desulfobacterales bacterium]